MSSPWPLVPLREVLRLQRRWLKLEPTETYREIGIRSFGKGIFHKAPVSGAALGNKRVLRIEPGDLVFNNVFAWEGAVAVAGPAEAGMIGSHRFVTYTVDAARCSADYLRVFFASEPGLEVLRKVSPGSAGRNRTLSLAGFMNQTVPLPSLEEQRRLVERIEALAAKIEEAKRLRAEATQETGALFLAAITDAFRSVSFDGLLGEVLLALPRNGWSARCDGLDGGVAVLSLGAITGFSYRPGHFKRTSEPTAANAHYWLRPGDLLLTRSNTPDLVGHAAIYTGQPSPCIYPDLMMRLEVDESKVGKPYLHYLLQSRPIREYIQRVAKGTSPTMKKISQDVVMKIPFPRSLPRIEQGRLVAALDALRGRTANLTRVQEAISTQVDAMLPAILDRAFKGEL